MNSKQKGCAGMFAVCSALSAKGYPVFVEIGDFSRVDIITLVDNRPIRIQVKTSVSKKGSVNFCTKSNNWHKKTIKLYSAKEIDMFAMYVRDINKIAFVSIKETRKRKSLTFRISPPENKQVKKIMNLCDYESFEKALNYGKSSTIA